MPIHVSSTQGAWAIFFRASYAATGAATIAAATPGGFPADKSPP